jgi:hypothetical protein
MALQLDVHVVATEDADHSIEKTADAVAAIERGAAHQRHQSPRGPVHLLERQRALAFRRAELHAGDQPAEVLIPLGRFAQDREQPAGVAPTRPNRQLRADNWLYSGGLCGFMKSRDAVDAVAIDERQRPVADLHRSVDEDLGKRRTLKKAEGRRGVELDIHGFGSIDDPIDEPRVGFTILKNPVHRAVAQRHVPFVAIPARGVPPVS